MNCITDAIPCKVQALLKGCTSEGLLAAVACDSYFFCHLHGRRSCCDQHLYAVTEGGALIASISVENHFCTEHLLAVKDELERYESGINPKP